MLHQTLPFLILCIVLGWVLSKWKLVPENTYRKINQVIIWITLPAITLEKIGHLTLRPEYFSPIISAWWLFIFAGIFFALTGYLFKWDKKTWAAMTLVCGLGNTSFVGFPVTRLLYGEEGIRYAVLVDQPGTFVCLATLGVALAAFAGSKGFSLKHIVMRLIRFPPFVCFIIALFLPSFLLDLPIKGTGTNPGAILNYIGSWMNPLAFVSMGLQFRFSLEDVSPGPYFTGLFYKLLLGPGLVFAFFKLMNWNDLMYDVTVMELAMPPMITASIIATEHDLRPGLSAAWINFGIPISAVTIYLWSLILG